MLILWHMLGVIAVASSLLLGAMAAAGPPLPARYFQERRACNMGKYPEPMRHSSMEYMVETLGEVNNDDEHPNQAMSDFLALPNNLDTIRRYIRDHVGPRYVQMEADRDATIKIDREDIWHPHDAIILSAKRGLPNHMRATTEFIAKIDLGWEMHMQDQSVRPHPWHADHGESNALHWIILCGEPVEDHRRACAEHDGPGHPNPHQRPMKGPYSDYDATAKALLDSRLMMDGDPDHHEHMSIDKRNNAGFTPLLMAAMLDEGEVVKMLLDHGSHSDLRDAESWTALDYAVMLGYTDIVKSLLKHHASVVDTDRYGYTPLHLAAEFGRTKMARAFIHAGAHPFQCARDGYLPVEIAEHYGHNDTARAIRKAARDHLNVEL